jgi:oligopeptide transport system permease protein
VVLHLQAHPGDDSHLLAVVTVCYLLLHGTPGGPFDDERKVSAAVLANLQAKYHLDLPLWQQYLYYLNSLLHGDLGASFRYADWSVNELVAKALPVSAAIGGAPSLSRCLSACSSAPWPPCARTAWSTTW